MASIINDLVVSAFKGRLGRVVFRHFEGKVFATMAPTPSTKPPSAGQQQTMQRLREAINYAKGVMLDPVRRAIYETIAVVQNKPVFRLARTDFFRPPEITRINIEGYAGNIGGKIVITALDEVAVTAVTVVIRASNGNVLEQGAAVKQIDLWSYTATTALAAGANVTIEVSAKDYPNNTTMASATYHKT